MIAAAGIYLSIPAATTAGAGAACRTAATAPKHKDTTRRYPASKYSDYSDTITLKRWPCQDVVELLQRIQFESCRGASAHQEPLSIPVERFLSMVRFENKAKLGDLGLEIDPNTQKFRV